MIQRPPAPLDSFQLIRIGGPKDLELPGLEKLDPHSEQTDEMSRVLYVVLVLPHHRFALLSHVATEVLVVELAKAVQGFKRQSPVTSDVLELCLVGLKHLGQRSAATDLFRERLVFGHPLEVESLHTLELIVRVAGERVGGRLRREDGPPASQQFESLVPVNVLLVAQPEQSNNVGVALEQ